MVCVRSPGDSSSLMTLVLFCVGTSDSSSLIVYLSVRTSRELVIVLH